MPTAAAPESGESETDDEDAPERGSERQRGSTAPDALVAMDAEDLATAERKAENERMRDFQYQKRDLDWSKKNRDRLNKQIGVDELSLIHI